MSKKNHRTQAQGKTGGAEAQGGRAGGTRPAESEPSTASSIRGTLEDGLNAGLNVAKDAVSSAKDMAHTAVEKAESIVHDAQETIVEAGHAVVDTAKKNPLPLALTGIGVACAGVGVTMLVLNGRRGAAPRTRASGPATQGGGRGRASNSAAIPQEPGTLKRAMESVTDEAGQLARRAQSSLQDASRSAGQAVRSAVRGAKEQGQRAGAAIQDTYQSNPLAVGAAVVAAGTIVGLVLPSTERENAWLGESRDQVVGKAKDLVSTAIDKVDHLVHPSTPS